MPGDRATLDAGCGNGAFSYRAYRMGNRVMGINVDPAQVQRCDEFRDFLGIDASRCRFLVHNMYDLLALGQTFDQVICFETLEHLERDQDVIGLFARVLNPGGLLHLCTPRLDREPYWGEVMSPREDGGHVRLGYTFDLLETMLAREGFEVIARHRVVGPVSQTIMNLGRRLSNGLLRTWPPALREGAGGVVVLALLPLAWLDILGARRSHLCIYVQARLREGTVR
jgi:SAM-dependent methyltransferase